MEEVSAWAELIRAGVLWVLVISAAHVASKGKDGWGWFLLLAFIIG